MPRLRWGSVLIVVVLGAVLSLASWEAFQLSTGPHSTGSPPPTVLLLSQAGSHRNATSWSYDFAVSAARSNISVGGVSFELLDANAQPSNVSWVMQLHSPTGGIVSALNSSSSSWAGNTTATVYVNEVYTLTAGQNLTGSYLTLSVPAPPGTASQWLMVT